MSRVMIIGSGPLPRAGLPLISAAALRTRQFLKPILEAGHTVNLFTIPVAGTEGPEGKVAAMMPDQYDGLMYQRFTNASEEFAIRTLAEQVRQLRPDAILAIGSWPAYLAARLPVSVPLWADLPGSMMAEAQAQGWGAEDDESLEAAWATERVILRRIDKFSAVSRPQLHATFGELAAVGRLNRHTIRYQFGHRVANAGYRLSDFLPPVEVDAPPLLRGPIVPADAFLILWCGGMNLWSDVPTLVEAMNLLMNQYPSVHFVVAGGRVEGVASRQFDLYEEQVELSPNKDRFHNLGWLAPDRLVRVFQEADLGINVDAMSYETLFGARSRINTMVMEGVPMVSTAGPEVVEWLEDGRGILTAPLGDASALAEAIEPWIEQREGLATYSRNARAVMNKDFAPGKTVRPLLHWLDEPEMAPDNQAKIKRGEGMVQDLAAMAINSLEEQAMALDHHSSRELQQALTEFDAARNKSRRRFIFGGK